MKKLLSAFYALALTTTAAHIGTVEADTSVEFGIGYRSDDINWKVDAPFDIAERTFSHLNFRDIEIFAIEGKIKGVCGECVYYRLDGQYGWVLDGRVRESDQFSVGSPSPGEVTIVDVATHNDIKRDYVADFTVAFGYPLETCCCPNLQFVPTIGFAYDTQRLGAKNRQRVSDELTTSQIDAIGLDPGERSHHNYRATWWGPFIGLDLAFSCQSCWNLYSEFEYHFGIRTRRERNSDTGFEFIDHYKRTKRASGFSLKIGSSYHMCCNWVLDGHLTYKRYTADDNKDRLTWRSIGIGVDIGYLF